MFSNVLNVKIGVKKESVVIVGHNNEDGTKPLKLNI